MKNNSSRSPEVNFAVIGVVKGGTTSLYHYLSQHPDIYLPPIKETNHFASDDVNEKHFLPTYSLDVKIDLDAYIKGGMKQQVHIAHVNDEQHYLALFSKVDKERAVGEISNSYMICPSSARRIHAYNPEMKILVVLRNPIRRAWSQYLMNLREAKTESRDFIEELKMDDAASPKGWGVNHQYLALGKYCEQLTPYIDLFGKDRVMAVFYESYRKNPAAVLKQMCAFLEVDPDFSFDFEQESNKASLPRFAKVNKLLVQSGAIRAAKSITPKGLRKHFAKALYSDKHIPQLSASHIEWLKDYYAQEVERLADLLGEEVYSNWPEFVPSK